MWADAQAGQGKASGCQDASGLGFAQRLRKKVTVGLGFGEGGGTGGERYQTGRANDGQRFKSHPRFEPSAILCCYCPAATTCSHTKSCAPPPSSCSLPPTTLCHHALPVRHAVAAMRMFPLLGVCGTHLSPHLLDIFEDHVAVAVKGLDTRQQLVVVAAVDQNLQWKNAAGEMGCGRSVVGRQACRMGSHGKYASTSSCATTHVVMGAYMRACVCRHGLIAVYASGQLQSYTHKCVDARVSVLRSHHSTDEHHMPLARCSGAAVHCTLHDS